MNVAPTLPHCVWVACPPRGPQAALGRPGGGLILTHIFFNSNFRTIMRRAFQ
jgi:hypothetical protein